MKTRNNSMIKYLKNIIIPETIIAIQFYVLTYEINIRYFLHMTIFFLFNTINSYIITGNVIN